MVSLCMPCLYFRPFLPYVRTLFNHARGDPTLAGLDGCLIKPRFSRSRVAAVLVRWLAYISWVSLILYLPVVFLAPRFHSTILQPAPAIILHRQSIRCKQMEKEAARTSFQAQKPRNLEPVKRSPHPPFNPKWGRSSSPPSRENRGTTRTSKPFQHLQSASFDLSQPFILSLSSEASAPLDRDAVFSASHPPLMRAASHPS